MQPFSSYYDFIANFWEFFEILYLWLFYIWYFIVMPKYILIPNAFVWYKKFTEIFAELTVLFSKCSKYFFTNGALYY